MVKLKLQMLIAIVIALYPGSVHIHASYNIMQAGSLFHKLNIMFLATWAGAT